MAISMGAALLGSAVIGAGASAIGSSKQSKAARQAANLTAQSERENRAFQEQIYNRNVGYLSPWMQTGQTANSAFMEHLGFPSVPSAFASYGTQVQTPNPYAFAGMEPAYGSSMFGRPMAGSSPFGFTPQPNMPMSSIPGPITTTATPSARSAFDTYRNSTGYDFRFNEGLRALQAAFGRNLESGASTKAAMRFGQGIASDEFGRYMQLLGDQSRLGLSGASALAGVGQNFGDRISASNTAAATAAANARLYAGNVAANNWANIGSSFGNALGWFAK